MAIFFSIFKSLKYSNCIGMEQIPRVLKRKNVVLKSDIENSKKELCFKKINSIYVN